MISLPARRGLGSLTLSALMLVSFAGCGDDSDSSGGSGSSGSSDVLDDDTLEGALITLDDLPDGFTDGDEDEDDDSSTGTCLDDIDAFDDRAEFNPESDAEAEFLLEGDQGQSQVNATLESYADAGTVDDAIQGFLDIAQDCTTAQGQDEDGVTYDLTLKTSEDEVVDGADRQVSVTVTGTLSAQDQSFPVTFGFLVAGVDNEVVAVGVSDVGAGDGVADQIDEIAQTQLDRLVEVA